MTFINLDSGGKVTAEWGVERRKQEKQHKTHNSPFLTQSVSLSLGISPHSCPGGFSTNRSLYPSPQLIRNLYPGSMFSPQFIVAVMPSSATPCHFSRLATTIRPVFLNAIAHGPPSQPIIPDPVNLQQPQPWTARSNRELYSADGGRGAGRGYGV